MRNVHLLFGFSFLCIFVTKYLNMLSPSSYAKVLLTSCFVAFPLWYIYFSLWIPVVPISQEEYAKYLLKLERKVPCHNCLPEAILNVNYAIFLLETFNWRRLWRLCVTTSFLKTRIESINLLYIYRDTQAFYTDETSALHVFPSGHKASIRANGI